MNIKIGPSFETKSILDAFSTQKSTTNNNTSTITTIENSSITKFKTPLPMFWFTGFFSKIFVSVFNAIWNNVQQVITVFFNGIFRLFFFENSFVETLEEAIESSESMDEASTKIFEKNPTEFLGKFIAETLLDPKAIAKIHDKKRPQLTAFIQNFKTKTGDRDKILFGSNGVFEEITGFLKLGALKKNSPFVKFFTEKKAYLIAETIKAYCSRVLDATADLSDQTATDQKNDQINAVRGVLCYFHRIATEHEKQPRYFREFIVEALENPVFDIGGICALASRKFDGLLKPTNLEIQAFNKCGENKQVIIHRLLKDPKLLGNEKLKGLNFEKATVYQDMFGQFEQQDFRDLANFFAESYPLAKEVCLQLEHISKKPNHMKKIQNGLAEAYDVLEKTYEEYLRPSEV